MDNITIKEIVNATGGVLLRGSEEDFVSNVSIDSRKCKNGYLFFAIIGENHDAHRFIPQVVDTGCETLVVSDRKAGEESLGKNIILVSDTTKAMQDLAEYYLKQLNLKKIAVTGSVGKTSTRDMLYYICSQKYKTGKTFGNFNNTFGLPLTIFTFDKSMEAAVLEMGMDNTGQIHRLADIVRPDIGVITNIGVSHIENLGSREGILSAKLEITDFFKCENTLIINEASDMLDKATISGDFQVISVGENQSADYMVYDVKDKGEDGIDFSFKRKGENFNVSLTIPGAHNALNAVLAIAACEKIGVNVSDAIEGLKKIELTGKRLTIREKKEVKIFDDTYNAAPDSMKSAVRTVLSSKGKRKVAIFGDMNELGSDSSKYHFEVGEYAGEHGLDMLIAIGEKAKEIFKGFAYASPDKEVHFYRSKEEFFMDSKTLIKNGDTIIVKASRTMELEQVVDRILSEQE